MNFKLIVTILLPCFLFSQNDNRQKKMPNDVRWVTKSKEYKSICVQTYSTINSCPRICVITS